MKKIQPVLLVSTLLFLAVGSLLTMKAHAANPLRLSVSPATTQVSIGTTFSLLVYLEKDADATVEYVSAHVTYPAKLLEVVSISRAGSAFGANNGPSVAYDNTAGTLTLIGSTGNNAVLSSKALVGTVVFRAKIAGTAAVSFAADSSVKKQLGSTSADNLLETASGATISVISAEQSPSAAPDEPEGTDQTDENRAVTAHIEASTSGLDEATVSESDTAAANPLTFVAVIGGLTVIGGVCAWLLLRHLARHPSEATKQQSAKKRLQEMANLDRSFEAAQGAVIVGEPPTSAAHYSATPTTLQSIEDTLVGVQIVPRGPKPPQGL